MEALAEKPTMIQEAEVALIPMFQKVFAHEEVEYLAEVRTSSVCVRKHDVPTDDWPADLCHDLPAATDGAYVDDISYFG